MAAIYADTIGDFGHQLNARRAAQAAAMQQAQAETSRFAMARRQAEQEQLNQRANIFAQAARAQQEQQRAQANAIQQFAFNKRLADANQAAQQSRLDATLKAQAEQNDARLEAQRYVAEQKAVMDKERERVSNASRLASSGALDVAPDGGEAGLVAYYRGQGLDEATAANFAAIHRQRGQYQYRTADSNYRMELARRATEIQNNADDEITQETARVRAVAALRQEGFNPPRRPSWLGADTTAPAASTDAVEEMKRRLAEALSNRGAQAFFGQGGGMPRN